MTETIVRQALRDSVDDVLEKMFFLQTLGESPDPEPDGSTAIDELAVRVAFQGEPSGSLVLRLTPVAARQIAADFLGAEEAEVSDLRTVEVVRELANMICGSVLSRVESATTFRLGAPEIVPPSEQTAAGPLSIRYAVELSTGRLSVNIAT